MPATFTPFTPLKHYNFDFRKYLGLNEIKGVFGNLPFYNDWVNFWCSLFDQEEEFLKDYMRKFPNSNPILQRMKHGISPEEYEMFTYEHITPVGKYIYHFDVERMKHLTLTKVIPVEKILVDNLYIDQTAPLLKGKLNDKRIPFVVEIFGVPKPFVCVDGNKRLKAQLHENKIDEIEAYVFADTIISEVFFGTPDLWYYVLHREMEHMYSALQTSVDENRILKMTQMYHRNRNMV
ncbi:hypothetical protein [Bacillus phage SPbetaL4]|nr:hypothetical protein [Bacillus phage SPbetaL4]